MLKPDQIELIQREIDGVNTPEESALFRSLMEVEPPVHLRRAILASLPKPVHSIRSQLRLITEALMSRRTMIYAGAGVAIVILIVSAVADFPPLGGTAGTMGDPPGVQQAARYRGRTMTAADVTLDNPEVKALLQNDQILRLVKSDVFRDVMNNESFRELQSSEAYQQLMSTEAFRELQSSEAYQQLMATESFRELQSSEAYQQLMSSAAYREAKSSEAYQQLMSSEAFRELQSSEAFRELRSNEAYQQLMSSESFRELQSSEAFQQLMSTEAFRELQSNELFRDLQSNEMFRAVSRDARLSEAFMNLAQ
jgi:hypothetical protein